MPPPAAKRRPAIRPAAGGLRTPCCFPACRTQLRPSHGSCRTCCAQRTSCTCWCGPPGLVWRRLACCWRSPAGCRLRAVACCRLWHAAGCLRLRAVACDATANPLDSRFTLRSRPCSCSCSTSCLMCSRRLPAAQCTTAVALTPKRSASWWVGGQRVLWCYCKRGGGTQRGPRLHFSLARLPPVAPASRPAHSRRAPSPPPIRMSAAVEQRQAVLPG